MIYLDYQATTPVAPEVMAAMTEALGRFGNPHSAHAFGRQAAADVELARERVQRTLGLSNGKLIFTSGATEALNMAIMGVARSAGPERKRIVTVATEHAAVIDTVSACAHLGMEPVFLPVDADGLIDPDIADVAIDGRTALVAVMQVNNEIGALQPIDTIARMAAEAGALFLCDAVQGFGRMPLGTAPDMVAISAHKIHGPKGIGALWLHDGLELPPLMYGGGQEQGLRSGTLSPLLCTGFGVAAELAGQCQAQDAAHVATLWDEAARLLDGWTVNGSTSQRYKGNLNIRRPGLDAARVLSECRKVALSLGSACASGSGRTSHVLKAIGLSEAEARSSIRLGFGRYTSLSDIQEGIALILEAADSQEQIA
jgi:cysteine desulfurase